ncbi:MAG: helix-hairpin-helix domain-containing protein, partial [Porcipelethomonas sp.]
MESVIYRNEQNGYSVLDVDAGGELITAVGELGDVEAGEVLQMEGQYVTHPKFGTQFNVEYCERKLPNTSVNICKYLSSGAIKGIGPALAKRTVDVFGEKTLEIMEKEPRRLLEIRGISPKKCESIADEVKKIFNLRHLMIFLSKYGIKSGIAMKAYQQWGHQAAELIKSNPYCLCSVNVGLSFKRAEALAKEMDISPDSHNRIEAGFIYILKENANAGHSCLPIDVFERLAKNYLQISETDFYNVYNEMIDEQKIYEYIKNERGFVYLDDYFCAESYIAGRIGVMQAFSSPEDYDYDKLIDIEEEQNSIHYETLQRKAITTALSRGIMIMTGGPGTGKTTT